MLAYFDNSKEIVGASSSGLGALIMQGGKAVAFSSKTLNSLGKMYANIERVASDCLGSEKFRWHLDSGFNKEKFSGLRIPLRSSKHFLDFESRIH